MRQQQRIARLALASGLGLAMASAATAQGFPEYKTNNEWKPTDAEVLQLPPYCQAQFRPKQFRVPGNPFAGCPININHFCPGLVALNRAMNPMGTMQQRSYILGIAQVTLRSVREKTTPSCAVANDILRAEQHAQMLRMLIK
jgi:hypothetical protein